MIDQLVTVAAVLLGALTTHLTTYAMLRQRNRHELTTRWDSKKLEAYETYIDQVRAKLFAASRLYHEHTKVDPEPASGLETERRAELLDAERTKARSFERVMLLGGDEVVEAAHDLNAVSAEVEWLATGQMVGTHSDWVGRNRDFFKAVNDFHDAARRDLGVQGAVSGDGHPQRDLLLPRTPEWDCLPPGESEARG
ncbi:hypothetical protein [Nocardia brasiliensis]|uniref:hypothetical protein n=1 Tax=Nocardia brasiliensis TaxID=37326 RepID=UPI00340F5E1A